MSLSVGRVNWDIAQKLLRSVREKVFVCEWRIPRRIEFDRYDKQALHVLVCDDESQEPIATGRLLPSGELSRIAVTQNYRHLGAEKLVIDCLLKSAMEIGISEVFINISLEAVDYFTQHDFKAIGAVYMEAGLPRQAMSYDITQKGIAIDKYYLSH